jgi:hypothetical protein
MAASAIRMKIKRRRGRGDRGGRTECGGGQSMDSGMGLLASYLLN